MEGDTEIWRVQRCVPRHALSEVHWHNVGYLFPFPTLERAITWLTEDQLVMRRIDTEYRYRIWNQVTGEIIPYEIL